MRVINKKYTHNSNGRILSLFLNVAIEKKGNLLYNKQNFDSKNERQSKILV